MECRIAPITLVFGPNASGKSSFRRALETFRAAFIDDVVDLAQSKLPKRLEYLSHGWTKSNPGEIPFGLGLTFKGSVSGVTQGHNLIPNSVEVGIEFADTFGGSKIEQVIGFVPGQLAQFFNFVIELEDGKLSDSAKAVVLQALADLAAELELLEEQDPLDFLIDAPRVGGIEKLSMNVSVEAVQAKGEQLKSVRSVIEHFNNSQQHVSYSDYVSHLDAELVSMRAGILAGLIESDLEKYLTKEPCKQTFSFLTKPRGLKLENVSEHFPSSFPIYLDSAGEQVSDESELEEFRYQDDLISSLLTEYIGTVNFLLTSEFFEGDDYWRDGDLDNPEDVVFEIRKSLKRNSELIKQFICHDFRTIGSWRGVPDEEAQGDSSELPDESALSKMNLALGKITNARYVFQFENTVGVRSSRNTRTVLDTFTGVTLPFGDVGTGLSQLLPILSDLATKSSGLTYIEQPELHLHPRAQGALMDVILDSWLEEENQENDRQFILETHSESMLLRLQKRIRSGDIKSEDVAIVFVDSVSPADSPDGRGYNNISEMSLDDAGDVLDPFPVSFAAMRLEDLL